MKITERKLRSLIRQEIFKESSLIMENKPIAKVPEGKAEKGYIDGTLGRYYILPDDQYEYALFIPKELVDKNVSLHKIPAGNVSIAITKSPKSKASRSKPSNVDQKKKKQAFEAIRKMFLNKSRSGEKEKLKKKADTSLAIAKKMKISPKAAMTFEGMNDATKKKFVAELKKMYTFALKSWLKSDRKPQMALKILDSIKKKPVPSFKDKEVTYNDIEKYAVYKFSKTSKDLRGRFFKAVKEKAKRS